MFKSLDTQTLEEIIILDPLINLLSQSIQEAS
jgi:hypothetical protein